MTSQGTRPGNLFPAHRQTAAQSAAELGEVNGIIEGTMTMMIRPEAQDFAETIALASRARWISQQGLKHGPEIHMGG